MGMFMKEKFSLQKNNSSKLNLLDEDGIVHDYAYEQECAALNALGDEIGHLRMYQNGYYHKYDQGKLKLTNYMNNDSYEFENYRTNIFRTSF